MSGERVDILWVIDKTDLAHGVSVHPVGGIAATQIRRSCCVRADREASFSYRRVELPSSARPPTADPHTEQVEAVSHYKTNLRDIEFNLFEVLGRDAVLGTGPFGEVDGENVGCAFLVRDSDEVARIRLVLVDPKGRGLGLGTRLVDECIAFARQAGYKRITLWTHAELVAARRIYASRGFTLTKSETKESFGKEVVSEHWDLTL